MSVIAIKKLQLVHGKLIHLAPKAIKDVYSNQFYYDISPLIPRMFSNSGAFEVTFGSHYDKNGNLLRKINVQSAVSVSHVYSGILLSSLEETKQFGFMEEEYLEVIYRNILVKKTEGRIFKRRIAVWEKIFPEREIVETDIV